MRNLVYAAAVGALLTATPALAAVDLGFSGISGSVISWQDSTNAMQTATFPTHGLNVSSVNLTKKQGGGTADYGGSTEAKVKISNSGKQASFTSGVAARGVARAGENPYGASASSTTGIDAVITNNGSAPVTLTSINSTIIQAGMGFMIQNPTGSAIGNNVFTGYGADTLGAFKDFDKGGAFNGQTIATASFSFNVYGDDYMTDGVVNSTVEPLYTLSGWTSLGFDDAGNVVQTSDVTDAQGLLNDFSSVLGLKPNGNPLPLNKNYLTGFQWDETDVPVLLNQLLGAGQSTDLYYRATASVDISAPCVSATECLVAYSGFGDPVGRGGGVQDFAFALNADSNSCPDDDSQICFSPQKVKPFSRLSVSGGAVPEPMTWVSMILGFGLMGAALRRRGALSYS